MKNNKLEEFLNQKGFNLVELPREDIKIFDVLHEENRSKLTKAKDKIFKNSFFVNYLGEIDTFFEADMSLPAKFDESKHKRWADATVISKEAGLSFSFLTNIINGINAEISPEILFNQTEKVSLDFNNVVVERYPKELLEQYINKGILQRGLHHDNDFRNGHVYIIYETAKCQSISVELYDKNDDIVKLSSELTDILTGAGVSASNISKNKTSINFEGENMLVFGFKALQLTYKSTHYKISSEQHQTLKDVGVPENIYNLLYPVTKNSYNTEKEFIDALKEWLQSDEFEAYKHILVNYCVFDKFDTKDVAIKHRDSEDDKIAENPVFINIAK